MLNIKLDDEYKIVSDSNNYMLQKLGQGQGEKNKGKETISTIGYYGSLEFALKSYKQLLIRESDITTINELLAAIKAIDLKIEKVLGGS